MSRTKHLQRDERRTDRALARQRRHAELVGEWRRESRTERLADRHNATLAMVTPMIGLGL